MATKKSFYQMMKEGPETWLQDALDAQEINEAERDAIQKFINAQTREEAEKQMDVLREAMANRPEFDLSQEERNEIAQTVDDLDKHRRQLQDDINQLLARQAAINKAGQEQTFLTAEQKEELDTITQTLQDRAKELGEETKRYSAYAMIQALATSEQAQEQANKWYEEVGRDQGKNLLTAFSEYAQVAMHALVPGHKEQIQDHLQKAEIASGKYQAAVARGFETQLRRMEPSRKERREDNKMTRQANKQIKKVQRAARDVRAKEEKLIRAAQKIALSEYKFRQRFNNIPGWQHGAPVDRTFQEITSFKQAQEFMMSRTPNAVQEMTREVAEARDRLKAETQTLNTVMAPMLAKLDQRQQALTEFVQDYQHAIHDGYVGQQRADAIFERLGEATKYAIFSPEFTAKLQEAGIQFDPKYQTIGAQAQQQSAPEQKGPTAPTRNDGQTQDAPKDKTTQREDVNIPRITPSAITRWDDYIAQTEKQNQPKCLCYRDKTGPHAIELDSDPKKRSEQIERFKQDHGDKVRFRVLDENKALEYLEIEGLKFRGARGMDKEHAQAWREFVDKAYSPSQNVATATMNDITKQRLAPAVELVEKLTQATAAQDVLTTMDELFKNHDYKDAAEILNIACDNLHNQGAQDFRQEFLQYVQDNHLQHTPYSATEVIQGLMDANAQNISGYDGPGYEDGQGIDPEIDGEEQGFDPTDGLA